MNVEMTVNGKKVKADTPPSLLLSGVAKGAGTWAPCNQVWFDSRRRAAHSCREPTDADMIDVQRPRLPTSVEGERDLLGALRCAEECNRRSTPGQPAAPRSGCSPRPEGRR